MPVQSLAQAQLTARSTTVEGSRGSTIRITPSGEYDSPWAMTFLPDGSALVTEKGGQLWLLDVSKVTRRTIAGVPAVSARGQGGLGDVIASPDFDKTRRIFLSYVERDTQNRALSGAAVVSAILDRESDPPRLTDVTVIWRQHPKLEGNGHYGHRLAFGPEGALFISSGERQHFYPAQVLDNNLGKIVRLQANGQAYPGNPFQRPDNANDVRGQIWSLGHRNPLGLAFDQQGQLWSHEMGPRGGDEFNRIERGANYGYPEVSEGNHYDGRTIPDHRTRPEFSPPLIAWTPVISPSGMVFYDARRPRADFVQWQGLALLGGLSSRALVLVRISDDAQTASEQERFEWGRRIREVEQSPSGELYLLEDKAGGRLLLVSPEKPE